MRTSPASTTEWATFARELGINLRRARAARHLTQEAVAEQAEISLYAYQQYERGSSTRDGQATNPRLATILAISQVLEVPIEQLLPSVPDLIRRKEC